MVEQTRQRSRWPIGPTLWALEISRGNYYRWRRAPRWERPLRGFCGGLLKRRKTKKRILQAAELLR